MKKILLIAAGIALLGFGCTKEIPKTPEQLEAEAFAIQPNDLIVRNQTSGQTVTVAETKFAKPGFLAVIERNEGDETIVGYSAIVPVGARQNQKIALTLLLEEGEQYSVRMYDDTDGDTEFTLVNDNPLYKPGTEEYVEKTFNVVAQ